MFKNSKLLGILLSIFMVLTFCVDGYAYYAYTQQSGANFFVGTADKADALEDSNEVRQILDDLGNLLGHTKRDDSYPADGTTGGTLTIPATAGGTGVQNNILNTLTFTGNYSLGLTLTANTSITLPTSGTLAITTQKLDDWGTPDDNTDTNASTTAHGLMPKLPNVATQFIDGTGAWAILATGDIPDLSATYQPLDTALTNISALAYVSASFIKLTANDTYAVRTIAEVKTDLSLNNVENTAISTWAGSTNITTLGTIGTGIWSGTALLIAKLPISTVTDADVTNVPNCNNVYDFCETTQAYYNAIGDLPTAVVSDGDTTHVPTSDNVHDFCETTKNYLQNTVEDTSPELGGELDAGAHSIGFTQQTITYNSGTTTVNWTLGNKAVMTFGAGNIGTFAFTNPTNPCNVLLMLIQDGTGSRVVTAWDADIKWVGGTKPTLTTTANGIDICSFYWNGTNYFGVASLAFATP